jgi:hypothetical protein
VPARALLDQFNEASDKLSADPSAIPAWLPTLQQYPPGILNVCESAAELSKQLVGDWLSAYMFKGERGGKKKAQKIASWLGDEDKGHLSHSRAITRDQLAEHGLKVTNLEDDPGLQDGILSVHHATMHTLGMAQTLVKIIENNIGRTFAQHGGQQILVQPQLAPVPQQPPVEASWPPPEE